MEWGDDLQRRFAIIGHRAPSVGNLNLNDLPGSGGRVDVLTRAINSALFVSHGIREDTQIVLHMMGGNGPPRRILFDGSRLGGHLSIEEQDLLRSTIDDYATNVPWWLVNRQRDLETNEDAHIIANEVSMTKVDDVSRLAEMKTYRGMRHRSGHKVRGQRLRSNGRKGSALGVQRKK